METSLGGGRVLVPGAFRIQRQWLKGWGHNPMFPGAPHGVYLYPVYESP